VWCVGGSVVCRDANLWVFYEPEPRPDYKRPGVRVTPPRFESLCTVFSWTFRIVKKI